MTDLSTSVYPIFSAQSNNINKSRMTLLVTRQQMLDDLFAESRNQLLEVSKDKTRYEKFLAESLVQVRPCFFYKFIDSVAHAKTERESEEGNRAST